jgi:putative ABC transport system substrate-binding protein
MRRIGVMMPYAEDDPETAPRVTALREGLLKLGWTEGRNIRFDHRSSGSDAETISKAAREIVDSRPALPPGCGKLATNPLPTGSTTCTKTTGIVPVSWSTAPVTGVVSVRIWLELLMEVVPRTARVMYLFNPPTSPYAQRFLEPLKGAASSIGVEVVASPVHDPREIETVIAGFAREPDGGLIVLPSAFMNTQRDLVTALAERYRLPAIYTARYWAESGGLISYGNVPADGYRQAASYIDQILRGAKPADLPVQMAVKFELVVNLKTAKAIGLKIPESFLVRADEVIE